MTFQQILVILFSTGNAIGMSLAVLKKPVGWVFTALAQSSMGIYLAVSGNWLHGLAQYVCLAISLWGLYTWTKQKREVNSEHGSKDG